MYCDTDGELKYPAEWPQCSLDVHCGEPPGHSDGGTMLWTVGDEDNYDTYVAYCCVNGSEFDTNANGAGDSVEIQISCRWNKAWDPWPVLPPCYITDCVDPFSVPEDTFLEEITSAWTRVNTSKQYMCKGMENEGLHTRFWESNRTLSTFSMFCNPDGNFQFEDNREEWPTCLEGWLLTNDYIFFKIIDREISDISCLPLPPDIPSHPDYILPEDDGHVAYTSMLYPQLSSGEGALNSTHNRTAIPRNFMANLT